MLNRIKSFEANFSLAKAAGIVGLFSLLGKFVALVRENIFASVFGQGTTLDTYYAAFRLPDFITSLFVMSTLSVAFLPVFTGALTKDKEHANKFANEVGNILMAGIAFLSLVVLVFLEPLTRKLVPGFSGQQLTDTLNLTRLILLSPILHALSTLFGGILNAQKKFLITSIAPIFYNLGIIIGVLVFYPRFGIIGLGYGAILGAVLQVSLQIVASVRLGFHWLAIFNFRSVELKSMAKLYIPRIFAFDLSNVTLIMGTIIGSKLVEGSISALNQGFNLQSVPVGIFAYSLAVATFPVFSELYALKEEKKFIHTLGKTIRQLLFFMIPISVLVLLLRAYIVRILLGRGNFTWEDTIMTFSVLGVFSFSLFSQGLTTLLSRAFFARHNTHKPVIINMVSIVINIALTFLLGYNFGVQGITSAFVISSVSNSFLLFVFLRNDLVKAEPDEVKTFDRSLFVSVTRITSASLAMGLVVYGGIYLLEAFVNTDTTLGIMVQSGFSGVFGGLVYLWVGKALNLEEAKTTLELCRKMLYSLRNQF